MREPEKIWMKRMGRSEDARWYDEVDFSGTDVLLLEWTHSGSEKVQGVDIAVCLRSTPEETKAYRLFRARDGKADSAFVTMVLEIEQAKLDARMESNADIIIANRNNSAAFTQVTPLVKAMLNYGGYAQEYFQYEKTLPLANADLTNSEKDVSGVKAADLAKYASVKKGTAPVGLNYKSGQLVLTSETTILFNFNLADGHKISEYTFKNGNKVLTPKLRSGNVYYVEIPNVASSELDTMYTVTVGNFSVSYAALTYAYNQLKKDTTEESLQNLLRSLVLYNKEANNYFNK